MDSWKQHSEPTNKIINEWETLSKMEVWCTYMTPITCMFVSIVDEGNGKK